MDDLTKVFDEGLAEPSDQDFSSRFDKLNQSFYQKFGRPFRVTGGPEGLGGIHRRLYNGQARDVGSKDLTPEQRQFLVDQGTEYGLTVKDYTNNWKAIGGSAPHIHINDGKARRGSTPKQSDPLKSAFDEGLALPTYEGMSEDELRAQERDRRVTPFQTKPLQPTPTTHGINVKIGDLAATGGLTPNSVGDRLLESLGYQKDERKALKKFYSKQNKPLPWLPTEDQVAELGQSGQDTVALNLDPKSVAGLNQALKQIRALKGQSTALATAKIKALQTDVAAIDQELQSLTANRQTLIAHGATGEELDPIDRAIFQRAHQRSVLQSEMAAHRKGSAASTEEVKQQLAGLEQSREQHLRQGASASGDEQQRLYSIANREHSRIQMLHQYLEQEKQGMGNPLLREMALRPVQPEHIPSLWEQISGGVGAGAASVFAGMNELGANLTNSDALRKRAAEFQKLGQVSSEGAGPGLVSELSKAVAQAGLTYPAFAGVATLGAGLGARVLGGALGQATGEMGALGLYGAAEHAHEGGKAALQAGLQNALLIPVMRAAGRAGLPVRVSTGFSAGFIPTYLETGDLAAATAQGLVFGGMSAHGQRKPPAGPDGREVAPPELNIEERMVARLMQKGRGLTPEGLQQPPAEAPPTGEPPSDSTSTIPENVRPETTPETETQAAPPPERQIEFARREKVIIHSEDGRIGVIQFGKDGSAEFNEVTNPKSRKKYGDPNEAAYRLPSDEFDGLFPANPDGYIPGSIEAERALFIRDENLLQPGVEPGVKEPRKPGLPQPEPTAEPAPEATSTPAPERAPTPEEKFREDEYRIAVDHVKRTRFATEALLEKKMDLPAGRASELLDRMEAEGVILRDQNGRRFVPKSPKGGTPNDQGSRQNEGEGQDQTQNANQGNGQGRLPNEPAESEGPSSGQTLTSAPGGEAGATPPVEPSRELTPREKFLEAAARKKAEREAKRAPKVEPTPPQVEPTEPTGPKVVGETIEDRTAAIHEAKKGDEIISGRWKVTVLDKGIEDMNLAHSIARAAKGSWVRMPDDTFAIVREEEVGPRTPEAPKPEPPAESTDRNVRELDRLKGVLHDSRHQSLIDRAREMLPKLREGQKNDLMKLFGRLEKHRDAMRDSDSRFVKATRDALYKKLDQFDQYLENKAKIAESKKPAVVNHSELGEYKVGNRYRIPGKSFHGENVEFTLEGIEERNPGGHVFLEGYTDEGKEVNISPGVTGEKLEKIGEAPEHESAIDRAEKLKLKARTDSFDQESPLRSKAKFTVTLDDGRKVDVDYTANWMNSGREGRYRTDHYEYHGDAISETGYRSDFVMGDQIEAAKKAGLNPETLAKVRVEERAAEYTKEFEKQLRRDKSKNGRAELYQELHKEREAIKLYRDRIADLDKRGEAALTGEERRHEETPEEAKETLERYIKNREYRLRQLERRVAAVEGREPTKETPPEEAPTEPTKPEPTAAGKLRAAKFRQLADAMEETIKSKLNSAIGSQRPTQRRARIAEQMRKEGEFLRRVQEGLRAIADAHERGDLPKELEKLTSKKAVYDLLLSRKIEDAAKKETLEKMMKAPPAEDARERDIKALERDLIGKKIPGYFPTPRKTAERVNFLADIWPGMKVLEPSAGAGGIADVIREKNPEADLTTYEINSSLRKILEAKGYKPGVDFLTHSPEPTYDRIVMNPPFEKGQDIEHVQKAFEMLKPGGKLVAIMSESPFFRTEKKYVDFRRWLYENGGTNEKLPEGTFKNQAQSTGANGRIVTIEKPVEKDFYKEATPKQLEEWKGGILGRLLVEGAKDLSDAELKRAFENTSGPQVNLKRAKALIDAGILTEEDLRSNREREEPPAAEPTRDELIDRIKKRLDQGLEAYEPMPSDRIHGVEEAPKPEAVAEWSKRPHRPGRLYLTQRGMSLLNEARGFGDQSGKRTLGIAFGAENAMRYASKLMGMARDLEQSNNYFGGKSPAGELARAAKWLAQELRHAANDELEIVAIQRRGMPGRQTVRHEEIHRAQRLLARAKGGVDLPDNEVVRLPHYDKVLLGLVQKGYKFDSENEAFIVQMEGAAHVGSGEGSLLGLTHEQSVEFLAGYFDLIGKHYGDRALDEFTSLVNRYKEVRDEVKQTRATAAGQPSGVVQNLQAGGQAGALQRARQGEAPSGKTEALSELRPIYSLDDLPPDLVDDLVSLAHGFIKEGKTNFDELMDTYEKILGDEHFDKVVDYLPDVFDAAQARHEASLPKPKPEPTQEKAHLAPGKPEEHAATLGKTGTAKTRGMEVETQFGVFEADEPITSHDTALNENPHFPEGLQRRDRTKASTEDQLNELKTKFDPRELGDNLLASQGAPIIGPDMAVESGNGRTILLRRIFRDEPALAKKYKDWLLENADKFGLDRAAIEKMKAPMLARIRKTPLSKEERIQFAEQANEGTQLKMSPVEVARSDSQKLNSQVMASFHPDEEGGIVTPANRPFLKNFLEQIVGPDRGDLLTAEGELSQVGIARVRNAIFAKAYGDTDAGIQALEKLAESPDDNVRRITNALVYNAGRFAALKDEILAGSRFPVDITGELARAAQKLSALREQGTPVEKYLKQLGLFGDELSRLEKKVLYTFNEFKHSAKAINRILDRYFAGVEGLGDPRQAGFWKDNPPTKEEIFEAAVEEAIHGKDEQGGLFGEGPKTTLGGETPKILFGPESSEPGSPNPPTPPKDEAPSDNEGPGPKNEGNPSGEGINRPPDVTPPGKPRDTISDDKLLKRIKFKIRKNPPPPDKDSLGRAAGPTVEPEGLDPDLRDDLVELTRRYIAKGQTDFGELLDTFEGLLGEDFEAVEPHLADIFDRATQAAAPPAPPAPPEAPSEETQPETPKGPQGPTGGGGGKSAPPPKQKPRKPKGSDDDGGPSGPSDLGEGVNRLITARQQHTKAGDLSLVPQGLEQHLAPHQREGVAKAIAALDKRTPEMPGGFINADGTGAGKTRQILAVAENYRRKGHPVLIIAPAEVLKPNWKEGTIAGSYANDGKAMGINFELKRAGALEPGKIRLTTYENLNHVVVPKDALVVFDESHLLKNAGSARSRLGREIADNASRVLFASATPADKPAHIEYLARAGVLEGKPMDLAFKELGLVQRKVRDNKGGRKWVWEVDPSVGTEQVVKNIEALFDRLTRKGLMIKRELSMEGVDIEFKQLKLDAEARAVMDRIDAGFGGLANARGLLKARILMHMRRQQEPYKIASVVDMVKNELDEGRQAVIFMARINQSEAGMDVYDKKTGEKIGRRVFAESEGTAKSLRAALEAAGIKDITELHGNAEHGAEAAMAEFQNGKKRVMIATTESGGTGINLDDIVGDRPRTLIMMTAPFSAVANVQASGRVWRMRTKTFPRIKYLFSDLEVDKWNAGIIASKMKALKATVRGEVGKMAVDPDELQVPAAPPQEEGLGAPDQFAKKSLTTKSINVRKLLTGPPTDVEDFKVSQRALEILKDIGVPGAEKYLSRKYLGVYKRRSKNVRVQTLFDVFVVAHEGTHAISDKYKVIENMIAATHSTTAFHSEQVRKDLTDIYEKYYPGGSSTHPLEKRMEEGFATLVENYLYDPATIAKEYPNLVKDFLTPGGAWYNPATTRLLDQMNSLVGDYAKMKPWQRIGARIVSGPEVVKVDRGFDKAQRLIYEAVNQFEPLKRAGKIGGVEGTLEDPFVHAYTQMARGSVIHSWLKGKNTLVIDQSGNWRQSEGTVKDYLGMIQGREKEFDQFLVARRVVADHNRLMDLENQIASAEALGLEPFYVEELKEKALNLKQVLAKDDFHLQDANATVEEFGHEFRDAVKVYDKINTRLLKFAENTGLVTQEFADEMRSRQGYSSWIRKINDELRENIGALTGSKSSQTKARSHKARSGSTLDIQSPVYNQITAIGEIIGKGLDNMIWQRVYELSLKHPEIARRFEVMETMKAVGPDGKIFYPQDRDPNLLKVWNDGHRVYVKPAPEFLKVAKTLRGREFDLFANLIRMPSAIFTRLTTSANPIWSLGNLTIDQFSALMNSKTGFKPIVDPFHSFAEFLSEVRISKKGGLGLSGTGQFEKYLELGGKRQVFASQYEVAPEETIASILGRKTKAERIAHVFDLGLSALELPSNLSEYLTRFAEFKRAKDQGKSDVEAMAMASEVTTPFQLKGNMGGSFGQNWRDSLPYFNASMQVMYKFARTTHEEPMRVATVASGLLAAALTSAIATFKTADDEQKRELANLPARELGRAIFLPSPLGKSLIRIRIPEQIGGLTGLAYLYVAQHYGANKPKFDEILDTLGAQLPAQLDVTSPRKAALELVPKAFSPTVAVITNTKSYPEILPIVPDYLKDKPVEMQYTAYTSKVGKALGKVLGVAPSKVDYWIKNQFGAVGGMFIGKLPAFPLTRQEEGFQMAGRAYNNFYVQRKVAQDQYTRLQQPNSFSPEEQERILATHALYEDVSKVFTTLRKDLAAKGDLPEPIKKQAFELLTAVDHGESAEKIAPMVDALSTAAGRLGDREAIPSRRHGLVTERLKAMIQTDTYKGLSKEERGQALKDVIETARREGTREQTVEEEPKPVDVATFNSELTIARHKLLFEIAADPDYKKLRPFQKEIVRQKLASEMQKLRVKVPEQVEGAREALEEMKTSFREYVHGLVDAAKDTEKVSLYQ